jgi:hypothetical protein
MLLLIILVLIAPINSQYYVFAPPIRTGQVITPNNYEYNNYNNQQFLPYENYVPQETTQSPCLDGCIPAIEDNTNNNNDNSNDNNNNNNNNNVVGE